jgi:cytochrome c553
MERFLRLLIVAVALGALFSNAVGQEHTYPINDFAGLLGWAYPVNPPDDRPPPDDGTLKRVPGSSKAMTLTQARDKFNVPDWHPDDHPLMPPIVEHGRNTEVWGCGYCHLASGLGRPENSSLAGLPVAYIVQQVADFKNGSRKSSVRKTATDVMIAQAAAATDAEVKAAAEYFAALKPKPWVKVIETDTVPKTHVSAFLFEVTKGGGTEPIGQRIIETPENSERSALRDAASGFVAYAPVGSIRRGEKLINTNGAGNIPPCASCHGKELKGLGPAPPLAGRSPSYSFRQLNDFKKGTRKGAGSESMAASVAALSQEDMLSIAAYIASRTP